MSKAPDRIWITEQPITKAHPQGGFCASAVKDKGLEYVPASKVTVKSFGVVDKSKASCHDCGIEYGSAGFPDLVIPHDVWNKISPTGDEGGLLCPSCICRALEVRGIETTGKFTSGPLCQSAQGDSTLDTK